jgi:phage terminase large subunit GpA-like protein
MAKLRVAVLMGGISSEREISLRSGTKVVEGLDREKYDVRAVDFTGAAGVDVQRDRIEAQIVAWGRAKESWLVDYVVLDGATARPDVWRQLTKLLDTTYRHECGVELGIARMAIDSGFATQEVYHWARQQGPGRVLVVKGYESGSAPIGQPSAVEVTLEGKKIKRGVKVWPVATGMLKSELYGWLKLERPTEESGEPYPPGYCHFPQMPEEFFKQLTAEQLVPKVIKGYRRLEWVKIRERNESLDTAIYSRAAAAQYGIDRFNERHWKALEAQFASAAPTAAPNPKAPYSEPATAHVVPVLPKPKPAPVRRVVRSSFLNR